MASPSDADVRALLDQWRDWLAARTDTLLSLDERARTAGTDADRGDVAAAFVARKAISDRLDEIAALAAKDRAAAVARSRTPLADDLGATIGSDLGDAATLLDLVLQRVERAVGGREAEQLATAALASSATEDLAVCRRLADSLGMQVNHVAGLAGELSRRGDLAATAAEIAETRRSLEAAAREREAMIQRWGTVAATLDSLVAEETAIRALRDRCREKVVQAPPLAVPSVAAVAAAHAEADATAPASLPWTAARGRMAPVLRQVERLTAALAEARRRFEEPLARRDELRGLLQAFADKANALRVMEHPDVEPLYREAKALLWAAPCDLARAGDVVDRYVAAVNATKGVAR